MSYYLNVAEAAKMLNLSLSSIYKLIDHDDPNKQLKPVNLTTYKGDGGYRFSQLEIDRIKPLYVRDELTPAEAAKKIGRSTTYIYQLLKKGLQYNEAEYRGKRTYLIKLEDLENFGVRNPNIGKYDTIYDKRTGAYLFQSYMRNNQIARLISIKRLNRQDIEAQLQITTSECISLKVAMAEGWIPETHVGNHKTITSYGYALFEFPKPNEPKSEIYQLINELFIRVGPSNLRILVSEDIISVEVKKSMLRGLLPETNPELIYKLKQYIRVGEIVVKFDGTLIDTGLAPVAFYLLESKKQKLLALAKNDGLSLQEWLEKHFE